MDSKGFDKNLTLIKGFYTYIGNIIDKGYSNDSSTLDNLCTIIKIYYEEIGNNNKVTYVEESDSDSDDLYNVFDNSTLQDYYVVNSDNDSSSTENEDIPSYMNFNFTSEKDKRQKQNLDKFMNDLNSDTIIYLIHQYIHFLKILKK